MEQKSTEEIGVGRKTSTFRQGRITGCSSYLKKEKKRKKQQFSRHWVSGNEGQWPLRNRKQSEPCNINSSV